MSKVHLLGIQQNSSDDEVVENVRELAREAFNGFKWLEPGQTVWLKVALNSDGKYPATTDWRAVRGIVLEVRARGGTVIVADQSGIEYDEKGSEKMSSSEYCYAHSGMAASGEVFTDLEKIGFEPYKDPRAKHWPNGFRVTRLLQQVDHIINLPRLSAHGMAEVTLGAKNWVGAIPREDRYAFHAQGPMYWFIRSVKAGSGEKLPPKSHLRHFDQMIAELALAFREKLRGTFFSASKVLMTMGPNEFLMTLFGSVEAFKSYVYKPEHGLLIASDDPVAADAAALAYMFQCWHEIPALQRLLQKVLIGVNGRIKEFDSYEVHDNPVIKRQLELSLGNMPSCVRGHNVTPKTLEEMGKRLHIRHSIF